MLKNMKLSFCIAIEQEAGLDDGSKLLEKRDNAILRCVGCQIAKIASCLPSWGL